ncbi:molybdopterin-dependent oxidoreductase [Seohaeicola saemankumensis]|uniref:xanthine dehydrogenase family protein molybdopterin-binding subunit n=1 Tax=Seohaeicola saemankumensis TaxID=481181 RepID=UPI001E3668DE|nr:molybdopterin cofactor-binding domain-containing protein [Seohaeicola saemankumensis]MCD1626438.1 molybdopterin-dependent oxidoreductase [Seohaeicola saemankumensis]
MASIGKIARRSFLIGSVAILGGVAFGVYKARQTPPNPLSSEDGAALNPYVLINADGVTIITPRAEMGQGIHSTLAALVAEELDVAWQDVTALHGPPAQAYYNGALMGAGMPFKDYALTDMQHSLKEALAVLPKMMSLQVTGGSTSTVDAFDKMRLAGATARETLKEAAAQRLGLARSDLATGDGYVIAPDGTRLSYVELAADAARIEPLQNIALRPASQWKYLGKSMPRLDIPAKVTGTATFGIDVRVEGMKFAALRRNPALGASMRDYDPAPALAMTGVERVVDLGDGIAVVANNTWIAMQAAEAVEIDWETSINPATTDDAFAVIAAAFDGKANSTMRDDGNTEEVPQGATEVTAEYRLPYLAHATMEPMNATAHMTAEGLTIWCGNQAPVIIQGKCADATGLAVEQVTVHTTLLGGGFGRRGESDYAVYAARLAAAMPGTPVQLTWSREEDMRHDFYRPGAIARFRGAVQDGRAVLLDGQIAAQSTTRQAGQRLAGMAPPGPDKGHVEGAFDQPYAIPNYRIRGYLAEMDIPVGFWRAVGNSFNGFFHDTFIDELAHAAGADPLEFRLSMMRDEHAPSAGTLEAVREMSGWTGQTPDGFGRGVGFTYSFGCPVAQVVEVIDEGGTIRINRAWIAADVGVALDPGNIRAQLEGGMIFGLSAAVFGRITFADGAVEQGNFPDYDGLRLHNSPLIETRVLETNRHMSGVGEPGTPPAMPALANALFDLTGKRARSLPLLDQFDLLI